MADITDRLKRIIDKIDSTADSKISKYASPPKDEEVPQEETVDFSIKLPKVKRKKRRAKVKKVAPKPKITHCPRCESPKLTFFKDGSIRCENCKKVFYKERRVEEPLIERFEKLSPAKRLEEIGRKLYELSPFSRYHPIEIAINQPKRVLLIALIITGIIGYFSLYAITGIEGDIEVYLPPEDPNVKVLQEVREDWSTDIIVIYVEAKEGYNVTNKELLEEMSVVELELDPYGQNPDFEEYPSDRGKEDGIVFCLSLSTVVKELNATPPLLTDAIKKEFGGDAGIITGDQAGSYTIPDQGRINEFIRQLYNVAPDLMAMLVSEDKKDTVILIGLTREVDQKRVVDDVEQLIKEKKTCKMTATGPVPIVQVVEERTFEEVEKILPIALIFIAIVLFFFHQTLKTVIICGTPIACSIILTLGILGTGLPKLLGLVLAPQFIVIVPILVALGTAWALYLVNIFVETPGDDIRERVRISTTTMHPAILLSVIAAAIATSALLISGMPPLMIVGFSLTVGVLLCYAFLMTMVPALIIVLNYKKKGEVKGWDRFASFSVKHGKKSMVIAVIITIISILSIPYLESNVDYLAMAPSDEPSLVKMREYAKKFGGGGLGMVLIQADMKDIEVLEDIEKMETTISNVEHARPLSVIDVMKIVRTPNEINLTYIMWWLEENTGIDIPPELEKWLSQNIQIPEGASFWDIITADTGHAGVDYVLENNEEVRLHFLNIFYNTLTKEVRDQFINGEEDKTLYTKTLVYVDMPILSLDEMRSSVNGVNDAIHRSQGDFVASDLTGVTALSISINDKILEDTIITNIASVFLAFLVQCVMYRSIKIALITTIPVSIVLAWQPLTLVATNVALSLITVMIGSIAVGIGIDYALQITVRIRALGGPTIENLKTAISQMGVSFVEATSTMLAGLSAIFFVPIPSIYEFIGVVMILLVFNAIVALLVLPGIYVVYINWKESKFITEAVTSGSKH